MIADSTGAQPDPLPISTEQHETYGLVHEYAIGRYTIKAPEGFYVSNRKVYMDKLAVREVKWPDEMSVEEGQQQLWDKHIDKLKNKRPRPSTATPKVELTTDMIKQYSINTSFYYDHVGEPIKLISTTYEPRVRIHKLVNYGTHGVWFFNEGLATKKDELSASLNALIQDYQPYADPKKAELKPGVFHLKRGFINRAFDRKEEYTAAIYKYEDTGNLEMTISVTTSYKRTDITRYRKFPNYFVRLRSNSNNKPKKIRYSKRTIANHPGYEYIIHYQAQKNPEYMDGNFHAWYSNTNYGNMYPEVAFHTLLYATKDFNQKVAIWDLMLNSYVEIAHQEN